MHKLKHRSKFHPLRTYRWSLKSFGKKSIKLQKQDTIFSFKNRFYSFIKMVCSSFLIKSWPLSEICVSLSVWFYKEKIMQSFKESKPILKISFHSIHETLQNCFQFRKWTKPKTTNWLLSLKKLTKTLKIVIWKQPLYNIAWSIKSFKIKIVAKHTDTQIIALEKSVIFSVNTIRQSNINF